MRTLKAIFIIFFIFFTRLVISQQNQSLDWEKININGVGSIMFPSSMEIQKGKFREYVNNGKKEFISIDSSQITIQQKGLNEGTKESFQRYARIILKTRYGLKGDFKKLNFNDDDIFEAELKEFNSKQLTDQKQKLEMFGGKLIDWVPAKFEVINGLSCVHICYSRQLNENPIVLVNEYLFYNNDRFHSLTMSYRISDSEFWKSEFDQVLKSFRITNVR
jgi:hypothetical protein